ncbi:hypothetical protein [Flavobacterium silvisoli]|nr:hypothetical protein [Flavobacterium silvisoli]
MKKTVIIIALIMLLKPVFPVVDYIVNYDYISKVLCVNKAKPEMHCNGKCHLMKQLAKEAENEKPLTPTKKGTSQETETFFCLYFHPCEVPQVYGNPSFKVNTHYTNLYDYTTAGSVFHPPAV